MSIPAVSPSGQPPVDPRARTRKSRLKGALAATVFGGALAATVFVSLGASTDIGEWITILVLGPVIAVFGVLVGSVLTAFKRTRDFAVGFLIASAILIFVTGGICVATLKLASGQL